MSDYLTRVTRLTIMRDEDRLFSQYVTNIEVDDEAAGEFVKIRQVHDNSKPGEIAINPDEWTAIRDAVEQLLREAKP